MKEVILCKGGELVLKGANRFLFERELSKNIKNRLSAIGSFSVRNSQSTIYVEGKNEESSMEEAYAELKKVFGIIAITKTAVCEKDIEIIKDTCVKYLGDTLMNKRTFKVEAKRADKKFPLKSPEISMEIGGHLLKSFSHLKVDVHNPDITVRVEVRDFGAYVHGGNEKGAGGLPIGLGGKASLLLSGGLDSPVAGYMVAKRGVIIQGIHFYSYPYTSERAKEKVCDLAKKMCEYCGRMNLYVVPFTEIQTEIKNKVKEEYFTLIMRRYMMKIAQMIAERTGSMALITGESIGQVASQTIEAMTVTGYGLKMPVFRPVIGMDKEEIVKIAREIDTFDISILPYEDCCTVFTPRHPKIKPDLDEVLRIEKELDFDEMLLRAVDNVEKIKFRKE